MSKYNRIYIGEDSFTITSSNGSDAADVELLYSLFNRIEFKQTDLPENGIEDVAIAAESRIHYDSNAKSLHIQSESENEFIVGVFSLSGVLVATSRLYCNDQMSVAMLTPETYIAVATDGEIKLTHKFIVK